MTTVSCTAVPPATEPLALHIASISSSIIICRPDMLPHYKLESNGCEVLCARQMKYIKVKPCSHMLALNSTQIPAYFHMIKVALGFL